MHNIDRMAPDGRRVLVGASKFRIGSTVFRIIRCLVKQAPEKLLQPMPGQSGDAHRCTDRSVASDSHVRVPSRDNHESDGTKNEARAGSASPARRGADYGDVMVPAVDKIT